MEKNNDTAATGNHNRVAANLQGYLILVREWDETLTCSSCAGTLDGIESLGTAEVTDWKDSREIMKNMGNIYQSVKKRFGTSVEIDIVDPRNQIYLFTTLWKNRYRFNITFWEYIKIIFTGIGVNTVIYNGRPIFRGRVPDPEEVIDIIGG